jgi:hypothetical protein
MIKRPAYSRCILLNYLDNTPQSVKLPTDWLLKNLPTSYTDSKNVCDRYPTRLTAPSPYVLGRVGEGSCLCVAFFFQIGISKHRDNIKLCRDAIYRIYAAIRQHPESDYDTQGQFRFPSLMTHGKLCFLQSSQNPVWQRSNRQHCC